MRGFCLSLLATSMAQQTQEVSWDILTEICYRVIPIVTVISTGDVESGNFARLVVLPTSTPPLHPLRFLSRTYNSGGPHTLLATHICWFLEYIYRSVREGAGVP